MTEAGKKAVTVLASLAAMLVLFAAAELAVRVAGVPRPEWPVPVKSFATTHLRVDPLLGPLARRGFIGRWPGGFWVRIDDRGFRATGLPARAAGDRRAVILGDSCSFGWGINTEETFFYRLDQLQGEAGAGLEVLNAAFPGQSAVAGVHMLEELVLPLDPKFVVLGFTGNNAFRFTLLSDADRFRFLPLRKLVLRSRLLEIASARLAPRDGPAANPRDRKGIYALPVNELRRVASPSEFEAALRTMVAAARGHGSKPIFLVFPRSSMVSDQFPTQDAAFLSRRGRLPPRAAGAPATNNEVAILETSCLQPSELSDPLAELHRRIPDWRPTYPQSQELRAILRAGSAAYVAGDWSAAEREFARAVEEKPDVPLSAYDLGVARLKAGRREAGLADLDRASRLACSIFLEFQVVLWRVAAELDVPVVDLTLHFQAQEDSKLFLDPAHPNLAAQEIIARALWSELREQIRAD
jgi:lysophospholipase L1-like esterase